MTAASWATVLCCAVFLCVLAALALDNRATKQKLRNQDGLVIGLRLDLEAARDRINELQGYLSDHDSWQTDPAQPVPAEVADRAVPDRWSASPNRRAAEAPPPATRPAKQPGETSVRPSTDAIG